jgi:hypothetical protein
MLPEDIYNELMTKNVATPNNNIGGTAVDKESKINLGSGDLALISQKVAQIDKIGRNKHYTPDSKEIRYNQEYKRYRKLTKDQLDKPINVRLVDSLLNNNNNNNVSGGIGAAAAASATIVKPPNNTKHKEEAKRRSVTSDDTDDVVASGTSTQHKASGHALSPYNKRRLRKNPLPRKPYTPTSPKNNKYKNKTSAAAAADVAGGDSDHQFGSGGWMDGAHKNKSLKVLKTKVKPTKQKSHEYFKPQLWAYY